MFLLVAPIYLNYAILYELFDLQAFGHFETPNRK